MKHSEDSIRITFLQPSFITCGFINMESPCIFMGYSVVFQHKNLTYIGQIRTSAFPFPFHCFLFGTIDHLLLLHCCKEQKRSRKRAGEISRNHEFPIPDRNRWPVNVLNWTHEITQQRKLQSVHCQEGAGTVSRLGTPYAHVACEEPEETAPFLHSVLTLLGLYCTENWRYQRYHEILTCKDVNCIIPMSEKIQTS